MFWKVLSSEKDNSPTGRSRYYVVAEEVGTGRKKTGYTYNDHFSKGRTCGCEINDLEDE